MQKIIIFAQPIKYVLFDKDLKKNYNIIKYIDGALL